MLASFDELQELVRTIPPRRIAFAGIGSETPFKAMELVRDLNGSEAIFIGNRTDFEVTQVSGKWNILLQPDELSAAQHAVGLVKTGLADIVAKGSCPTGDFMRACLDPVKGLRGSGLMAQIFVFVTPYSHGLKLMSDGAVTIKPGPKERTAMIENAVPLARALGSTRPRVGLICALEKPTPKLPETMEAAEVAAQSERWAELGCYVEGPISIDCALDPESAAIKGMTDPVSGNAEILIFPDLSSANIFAKGIALLARTQSGAVVLGGSAPIVLRSRSDTVQEKYNSILLGLLAADKIFRR